MVPQVSPCHGTLPMAPARLVSSTGYWRRCAATNALATMKSSLPKAPGKICCNPCFWRVKCPASYRKTNCFSPENLQVVWGIHVFGRESHIFVGDCQSVCGKIPVLVGNVLLLVGTFSNSNQQTWVDWTRLGIYPMVIQAFVEIVSLLSAYVFLSRFFGW